MAEIEINVSDILNDGTKHINDDLTQFNRLEKPGTLLGYLKEDVKEVTNNNIPMKDKSEIINIDKKVELGFDSVVMFEDKIEIPKEEISQEEISQEEISQEELCCDEINNIEICKVGEITQDKIEELTLKEETKQIPPTPKKPEEINNLTSIEETLQNIDIPIVAKDLEINTMYKKVLFSSDSADNTPNDIFDLVEELENSIKSSGLNYILSDKVIDKKTLDEYNLDCFIADENNYLYRYKELTPMLEKYQSPLIKGIVRRINNAIKESSIKNDVCFSVNITINNKPVLTDSQILKIISKYKNLKLLNHNYNYLTLVY